MTVFVLACFWLTEACLDITPDVSRAYITVIRGNSPVRRNRYHRFLTWYPSAVCPHHCFFTDNSTSCQAAVIFLLECLSCYRFCGHTKQHKAVILPAWPTRCRCERAAGHQTRKVVSIKINTVGIFGQQVQCQKTGRLLFHEVCFMNSTLTRLDFKGSLQSSSSGGVSF